MTEPGQVILAPVAVPGRGTHAVFRDPQGAVFGVLATKDGDPPDEPVTDGDVFWLDLFTPDPSRALAFYAGLGVVNWVSAGSVGEAVK